MRVIFTVLAGFNEKKKLKISRSGNLFGINQGYKVRVFNMLSMFYDSSLFMLRDVPAFMVFCQIMFSIIYKHQSILNKLISIVAKVEMEHIKHPKHSH